MVHIHSIMITYVYVCDCDCSSRIAVDGHGRWLCVVFEMNEALLNEALLLVRLCVGQIFRFYEWGGIED